MRHLFHRRANERGETFPLRLSNDPQPVTEIPGSVHHRILRKRIADCPQWVIKRKIARNNSREHTRLACGRWRLAIANFQKFAALLEIKSTIRDRPHKA